MFALSRYYIALWVRKSQYFQTVSACLDYVMLVLTLFSNVLLDAASSEILASSQVSTHRGYRRARESNFLSFHRRFQMFASRTNRDWDEHLEEVLDHHNSTGGALRGSHCTFRHDGVRKKFHSHTCTPNWRPGWSTHIEPVSITPWLDSERSMIRCFPFHSRHKNDRYSNVMRDCYSRGAWRSGLSIWPVLARYQVRISLTDHCWSLSKSFIPSLVVWSNKKSNGEQSDLCPWASHFETTASSPPLRDHLAANMVS